MVFVSVGSIFSKIWFSSLEKWSLGRLATDLPYHDFHSSRYACQTLFISAKTASSSGCVRCMLFLDKETKCMSCFSHFLSTSRQKWELRLSQIIVSRMVLSPWQYNSNKPFTKWLFIEPFTLGGVVSHIIGTIMCPSRPLMLAFVYYVHW